MCGAQRNNYYRAAQSILNNNYSPPGLEIILNKANDMPRNEFIITYPALEKNSKDLHNITNKCPNITKMMGNYPKIGEYCPFLGEITHIIEDFTSN